MKRLLTTLFVLATPVLAFAQEHAPAAAEGAAKAVEHAAGGHEAAGGTTPFAGTVAQSIAAIIVFLVVFFVLKAKAWGPILQGLTEREGKIRSDLEAAEKARLDAQGNLEQYKSQLATAEGKVREMFAAAQKDAEATATRIKQQAQQEAEDAKARAMKEIDEARRNAILDVQAQAGSIATLIASKILKRSINEQDQAELVRASLDEMGRK
ncbi:MAG: F0F1 ATP synthase subunit B [Tepidisphaeraceae bacterium]